jgi:hypothetical protein
MILYEKTLYESSLSFLELQRLVHDFCYKFKVPNDPRKVHITCDYDSHIIIAYGDYDDN